MYEWILTGETARTPQKHLHGFCMILLNASNTSSCEAHQSSDMVVFPAEPPREMLGRCALAWRRLSANPGVYVRCSGVEQWMSWRRKSCCWTETKLFKVYRCDCWIGALLLFFRTKAVQERQEFARSTFFSA